MTQPSNSPVTTVVVAVDTSPIADLVVERAAQFAGGMPGARLHLAHSVDTLPVAAATVGGSPFGVPSAGVLLDAGRQHLQRLLKNLEEKHKINAVGHLMIGNARSTLLQLVTNLRADLLITGTHDPGKLERLLLGSVANDLVSKAPCPVMVVRAKREAHPEVPEILPPCPDCVATQQATGGQQLWCERHSQHHPRAHTFYEYPDGFAIGSSTFRD